MAVVINGNGTVTGLTSLPSSAMASDSVIQQVSATFAAATDNSDAATSSTYSDNGITATITPSSGSKILILLEGVAFGLQSSSTNVSYFINLVGTPVGGSATQHRETQMRVSSGGSGTHRLFDSWNINFMHTHGLNGSTAITYKSQTKTEDAERAWARYRGASIVLLELKG
tara:strand:+ start:127 stop:639 length:513 start_codon:yes stop_codon:yes gene_type:complete